MTGWNLDWLLGPRIYSVVNDCEPWPEIYACPTSRVTDSDEVLATGLRQRPARRLADRLARQHRPKPIHPGG